VTTADHQHIPANQADLGLTTALTTGLTTGFDKCFDNCFDHCAAVDNKFVTAIPLVTAVPLARSVYKHANFMMSISKGRASSRRKASMVTTKWHAVCMASMTCQMALSHQSLVWYSQCLPIAAAIAAKKDCSSSMSGSSRTACDTLLLNMMLCKGPIKEPAVDQQAQHAQHAQQATCNHQHKFDCGAGEAASAGLEGQGSQGG